VSFTRNCGSCHDASDLVASNPIELKNALQEGALYPAHADLDIPDWNESLSTQEQTRLLNFLVAPDGQRLYDTNCSTCHGRSVAFAGDEEQLRALISQGGLHLEMPAWKEKLTANDLDLLAAYVVDPASNPQAQNLFQLELRCLPRQPHSQRDRQAAGSPGHLRRRSARDDAHWGQVLTAEQLDALVSYTICCHRRQRRRSITFRPELHCLPW
jgi:mono/diheme cytochrome c family protein